MTKPRLGTFGVVGHYAQWLQRDDRHRQHLDCRGGVRRGVVPPHRRAYPNRFLLGIGVGHPEAHQAYEKPHDALTRYLDELDEYGARARELVGPDAFIAPEHEVVPTTDAEQARAVGREALEVHLNMANYTNDWKRLGFTDTDIAKPGSDALIDAVVAHGTVDAVAARLGEHVAAGADDVPVQVLAGSDKLVSALAELAGPLGRRDPTAIRRDRRMTTSEKETEWIAHD